MQVLGDRILIEVIQQKSGSPIELPDSLQPKPCEGIVRQRGTGKNINPEIKVGRRVHFDNRWGSVDLVIGGKAHKVISCQEVDAILA